MKKIFMEVKMYHKQATNVVKYKLYQNKTKMISIEVCFILYELLII